MAAQLLRSLVPSFLAPKESQQLIKRNSSLLLEYSKDENPQELASVLSTPRRSNDLELPAGLRNLVD